MNDLVKPFVEVFTFNKGFYLKMLEGISANHLLEKVNLNNSNLLWIAGHVNLSRYFACKLIREDIKSSFEELFNRGAKYDTGTEYPDITEITNEWEKVSEVMMNRLGTINEKELKEIGPFSFPIKENNRINNLSMFLMHESYHIGQMGYLRKMLGYESALPG